MRQRSQRQKPSHFALCAIFAGFVFQGASAAAQDVTVDYDRQADFSRCRTYAWAPGQPAQNPLVDQRIVKAIDQALAGKGWTRVADQPDCYVLYQASVKEEKELEIWGSGGRFLGGTASVDVNTVRNGMLVVDIGNAATQQLIWRGIAKDTLSDKPEKNQKKLGKAMEKMFKNFPPESKAS